MTDNSRGRRASRSLKRTAPPLQPMTPEEECNAELWFLVGNVQGALDRLKRGKMAINEFWDGMEDLLEEARGKQQIAGGKVNRARRESS